MLLEIVSRLESVIPELDMHHILAYYDIDDSALRGAEDLLKVFINKVKESDSYKEEYFEAYGVLDVDEEMEWLEQEVGFEDFEKLREEVI